MTPEEKDINWLKIYVDAEFKAVREAVKAAEQTNKEAIDKVERTYADYRAQQNEWRGQSKDREGMFMTRREMGAWGLAALSAAALVWQILK